MSLLLKVPVFQFLSTYFFTSWEKSYYILSGGWMCGSALTIFFHQLNNNRLRIAISLINRQENGQGLPSIL
ncbi:hypothetical protein LCGC14_0677920 [marine sediment metagenome]|uniref:Uncharacterized protein n=1 Tax=marine sediment metagenome TaxID=412755 RepID=A0A0F9TX18_9ZZZZ